MHEPDAGIVPAERATLAPPFAFLLVLFLAPFALIARISLSHAVRAQPPYAPAYEPGSGWDGVRRSTVFRARPDERWKGQVAMPVESLLHATRAGFAAAKKKVRDALS